LAVNQMRRIATGLALAIALVTVGLPLAGVAVRAVWPAVGRIPAPTGAAAPGGAPATTGQVVLATLGVPLLIALGAVAIAWPTCWLLRGAGRKSRAALALLAVPMLMPSYLAYSGFGLARAPGTWIGEIVNRWPPSANVLFGQSLAVVGLMLWCWPLATVALLGAVRRVEQEHLDQLALSGAGPLARLTQRFAMVRGAVLSTLALVALLMLGSAVPLHLAQIPTIAIDLWARLALDPTSTTVWLEAWPLMVVAVTGSVWITRWTGADEPHEARTSPSPGSGPILRLLPVTAWLLGVAVPLYLFASSLHHTKLLSDFWREDTQSMVDSLAVAAAVGLILAFSALAAWYAAEHPTARRIILGVLSLQLLGLLLPGVLMGSAVGGLWNHPILGGFGRWVADSTGIVVLGHLARFGALGTAAGLWLARLEAPSLRDARRLAGGEGVRVWLSLAVRPQTATLAGITVAGGCLSLHEIEATVQLQPPGYRSLAQIMLDHLHMNSVQELAAAGINVLTAGVILAAIAGWLLGRASEQPVSPNEPDATGRVPNR
jgi:ABC-type Fe3+ transport system permease subunit